MDHSSGLERQGNSGGILTTGEQTAMVGVEANAVRTARLFRAARKHFCWKRIEIENLAFTPSFHGRR
jgi:uncharacterized protein YaaQ